MLPLLSVQPESWKREVRRTIEIVEVIIVDARFLGCGHCLVIRFLPG